MQAAAPDNRESRDAVIKEFDGPTLMRALCE